MLDAIFGFSTALFIFGNPCGLFQIHPKLFGFSFHQLGNHALFDNRITAWAKSGAQKYILNIATSTSAAVQQVIGLAITTDLTADRYIGVSSKFPTNASV